MNQSTTVHDIGDWNFIPQNYSLKFSPTPGIYTVFDAFRTAELGLDWDTSSNKSDVIFQSRTETFSNVPKYFEHIASKYILWGIYFFFIGHRDLIDIIALASEECVKRFRKKTQLSLEILRRRDPQNIFALYVRHESYQKNITAVMDEISKQYQDLIPLVRLVYGYHRF